MSLPTDLVVQTPRGLYCPLGDFYIDPWRPVERAVITHAHADHARAGHQHYLASADGAGVLRTRLGDISLETLAYGERRRIGAVELSLHPAGHVLGSAQVRLEHRGRVWVASGDYKTVADVTCAAFEPVRCEVFISECTFGLPIYRWRPETEVFAEIAAWWQENAGLGRASLLACYAFGKAQRVLAGLKAVSGPIVVHGSVLALNRAYEAAGVALPKVYTAQELDPAERGRALVLAPPSALVSPWVRRFGDEAATAFASGWMQLRGARRRGGYERGFVLSDHADWPGLTGAIAATGAERVILTHGYEMELGGWLREQGLQAESFATEYGDERLEEEPQEQAEDDA